MSQELFDLLNISFVLFIGWVIFHILYIQKESYIKGYKKIALLFITGSAILFAFYFRALEQYFAVFSFLPIVLLVFFYLFLIFVYHFRKYYRDNDLVEHLESRRVYLASMSYRYLFYKSFDILFQQLALLCIFIFLKEMHIAYGILVVIFASSFAISHFFMLKRGQVIGGIFLLSALAGGLLFPLLFTLQYGIIYTYILHWGFYLTLGMLAHTNKTLKSSLAV